MNTTTDQWTEAIREARACLDLPTAFSFIEECDKTRDYARRAIFVYHALALAAHKGLECGIRFDAEEGNEWPVVVIKLPTGEVAWHCKAYDGAYDGHSTEEKYARIHQYEADPLGQKTKNAQKETHSSVFSQDSRPLSLSTMSQPVVDLPLPETQATLSPPPPPLSPPCTQVVMPQEEEEKEGGESAPVPSSPRQQQEEEAAEKRAASPSREEMRTSSPSRKRSRSASPPPSPLASPIKRARKADDADVATAGAATAEPVDAIDAENVTVATQV